MPRHEYEIVCHVRNHECMAEDAPTKGTALDGARHHLAQQGNFEEHAVDVYTDGMLTAVVTLRDNERHLQGGPRYHVSRV